MAQSCKDVTKSGTLFQGVGGGAVFIIIGLYTRVPPFVEGTFWLAHVGGTIWLAHVECHCKKLSQPPGLVPASMPATLNDIETYVGFRVYGMENHMERKEHIK